MNKKIARPPNIVLIVMDTARSKSFSTYRSERKTTPNIDRIAQDAVVYQNCFSAAPWTTPSHVSLFTGLYPYEHGVNSFLNPYLPEQFISLPQILRAFGYKTWGISSNRLIAEWTGFSRGFDVFLNPYHLFRDEDTARVERLIVKKSKAEQLSVLLSLLIKEKKIKPVIKAALNYLYYYGSPVFDLLTAALRFRMISRVDRFHVDSRPITMRALSSARKVLKQSQHERKPLFLFINFLQNHTVYNPPRQYRNIFVRDNPDFEKNLLPAQLAPRVRFYTGLVPIDEDEFKYLQGLYDEEMLFLDEVVGQLYQDLKNLGLDENTLFIITSDHGEHIGEKGHFTHFFSLYNELIHVPLIVKYPKNVKQPGTDNRLVQTHDLFATIMDLVGSPLPAPRSSVSLLGTSRRGNASSQFYYDKEFYFKVDLADLDRNSHKNFKYDRCNFPHRWSLVSLVSSEMHKIIKSSNGTTELYDLNKDLGETQDLSKDESYKMIKDKLLNELDQIVELKAWMKE